MLKLFSKVEKSSFVFLQRVISVHIKNPGLDIALAQEGSTGGQELGLCQIPVGPHVPRRFQGHF